MNEILDNLIDAGWRDAVNDPPSDAKPVQIAWDDGSTWPKEICFYDSNAAGGGNYFWWTIMIEPLPNRRVIAWRELISENNHENKKRNIVLTKRLYETETVCRQMNKIYNLLGRLEGVKGKSPKWKARCPAHNDRSPSLVIDLTDEGRILVHCFAGCGASDIMESVGLSLSDLFDGPVGSFLPPVHRRHREPEIIYGNVAAIRLAEACRRKDREIEELRKQLETKTISNSGGRKDT